MPLLVEMGWGGLVQFPETITWTDITDYVDVVKQGVTITRGASDELSEAQPGTATLQLDNADGRFTPGNAASPYYPFVRKNAPIRISVAVIPSRTGSGPWSASQLGDDFNDGRLNSSLWINSYGGATEANGRGRVPCSPGLFAGLQTTRNFQLPGGQITVRVATLPSLNGSSAATGSAYFNSTTSGTRLGFQYNAATGNIRCVNDVGFSDGSAVSVAYNEMTTKWWRIREDSGTVYWETSGDGWTWTVRRSAATPAWASSQLLTFSMDTSRTGGTGDFYEVDMVGAVVRPRFYGMVNEFPIEFEGLTSTVTVSATDLFKRLNKLPVLRSMLSEEILHQDVSGVTDVLGAYYPLTEPSGSQSAGDLSGTGCGSLAVTQVGSPGGSLEFGSEGLADTGDTSVTFSPAGSSQGKYLTGDLGAAFQAAAEGTSYVVEFWVKTTTTSRAILGLYEPNLDHQLVFTVTGSGELAVEHTESGGSLTVYNTLDVINDGNWHHVVFDSRLNATVYIDGVHAATSITVPAMSGLATLHVGGYRSGRLFVGQIAHVAITLADGYAGEEIAEVHYEAATTGFSGEAADDRILRLARYAGLSSVTVWGSTHDAIASQGPAGSSVVARMREVEATESARLFAERDYYGIAYQSRDVRYNPDPASEVFTIEYADLETKRVRLADDDQKLVNEVDATRPGGATQRVVAPASVFAFGTYPRSLSILKTSDNSVLDAAYWLVSRYANPVQELREVPVEAFSMPSYLDVLDADISSYFSVTDMPDQAPASSIRVTVEGYTETIKHNSHLIQFHTSATATDTVWLLDDPTYSVLDSTTRLAY